MNSGLHLVDTALWLVGRQPESVFGVWSSHIAGMETDDRLAGVMIFPGDVYASVAMTSEASEVFRPRLRVVGTRASFTLKLSLTQKLLEYSGPKELGARLRRAQRRDEARRSSYGGHPADLMHLEMMDAFVAACRTGDRSRIVGPTDAYAAVEAVNALYRSGRTRRLVAVG